MLTVVVVLLMLINITCRHVILFLEPIYIRVLDYMYSIMVTRLYWCAMIRRSQPEWSQMPELYVIYKTRLVNCGLEFQQFCSSQTNHMLRFGLYTFSTISFSCYFDSANYASTSHFTCPSSSYCSHRNNVHSTRFAHHAVKIGSAR